MPQRKWRAALAALVLLFLVTPRVRAHANLLVAEPARNSVHAEPPTMVVLQFSEPLAPEASGIEVLNSAGQPVTGEAARVDEADATIMRLPLPLLSPGTYTVSWRALSTVDGHLTRGVYPFVVGDAPIAAPPVAPAGVAGPGTFAEARPLDLLARILTLLGAALVSGGFAIHLVLWRPVRVAAGLPMGEDNQRLGRLLGVALVMLATGAILQALTPLVETGDLSAAWAALTGGRVGLGLALRGLLLLPLAAAALGAARGERRGLVAGLLLSLGLLATISALSHSAALEWQQAAAILNDWLHLAAASVWIGGLLHLVFVATPTLRWLVPAERGGAFAMLIGRFSMLGIAAVAALVISGIFSGWLHVGSLDALRATAYGQTLVVKVALIVPLLALAALNLLYWRRQVAAGEGMRRGFVRTLWAEVVAGLLVLGAAALLTALGPGATALEAQRAGTLVARQPAGPLAATLTIRPARPGPALYDVRLTGPDGGAYGEARTVRLRFTPPDPSLGTAEALAEPRGDGHYVVEGAFLSLAGRWSVELQIQRPDAYDLFTRFNLIVDRTIEAAPEPGARDALALWLPWMLAGVGLALALFALWLRTRRAHRPLAPLVLVFGLGLLVVGMLAQAESAGLLGGAATANPIQPAETSIARGQVLFEQHCAVCHGAEGRGDGPAAGSLDPPPAELRVHVPLHTDVEIFDWITHGIPGTAMPAMGDVVAPEDRWHIINFLRRLTAGSEN